MTDDNVTRLQTPHVNDRFVVRPNGTSIYDRQAGHDITIHTLVDWANNVVRVAREQVKEAQGDEGA